MTSLNSSGSLGNVVSRLAGLKNVRPRRVMPGAEFLQDLEDVDTDVSGTSQPLPNFANLQNPSKNLPESDLGGELTPQSYDVRANSTQEQKPQEKESFWSNFGRALAMQTGNVPANKPPIETRQVEESEGLNPNEPPIGENVPESSNSTIWSTIGNALKSYVEPFGTEAHTYGTGQSDNRKLIENAQMKAKGINPEQQEAEKLAAYEAEQNQFQADMERAQQNPMAYIVYGATDRAANMPEIQKEINKIAGIDFTDQIADMTKKYEKVLSDQENLSNQEMAGYDEQMRRINERIMKNQASEADKFYIGLALLMPVLVGAMFGKEAGLGALAGSAKGISDVYGNRIKNEREDEALLADIGKLKGQNELKRSELELEKLKIPEQIKKGLPKDEKEYLVGKNEVTWTDPETGETQVGVEIKPGLVARPEFVTNKEELKEMRKEASDISEAIVPTQDIQKLTKDIITLSSKLKDKNIIGQAFASLLANKDSGLASKFGEEIEFEGRKVNSYIALEHKLKLLTDAYRQAKGMRALTNTVQEHIDSLFRNPSASFQNYRDTIDQMLYTRDLTQNRLYNTATTHGFEPLFLMEKFGKENKDVYNKLNEKEGEALASQLLKD